MANELKVSTDQTTPGTTNLVEAQVNGRRNGGVLHRTGVVATDKLAIPATPTLANNAGDTAGSLAFATAYNFTLAAGNRWGDTTVPTVGTATTPSDAVSTHTVRATFATVSGADFYDLFMSTAASPLWVARVTEAQRASGGFTVTAVGTVTQVGSAPAGSVDIRLVGTGLASNVAPFNFNAAYTPTTPTAVNCTGYSTALVTVRLTVTDLRSLPTCQVAYFYSNQISSGDLGLVTSSNLQPLGANVKPLVQAFAVSVFGATGFTVLIDTLTGQGSSVEVWVELVR